MHDSRRGETSFLCLISLDIVMHADGERLLRFMRIVSEAIEITIKILNLKNFQIILLLHKH